MATMTFLINDQTTSRTNPMVWVTISENAGKLDFAVTQQGNLIGDLQALYFDINDESKKLSMSSVILSGAKSSNATPVSIKQGDDNVTDLLDGTTMSGLLGSGLAKTSREFAGYDVGIKIGTAGIGKDDIRGISFTLSADKPLSLADVSGVDFGVRLTSVGTFGGDRNLSSKILEITPAAMDAQDDVLVIIEDETPKTGNILSNDTPANGTVTGWSGVALGTPVTLTNTEGATLKINDDGSYVLNAVDADKLSQGEKIDQNFTYDARKNKPNDANSWSTDTANIKVTVNGVNDAPVAVDDANSTREGDDPITVDAANAKFVVKNDSDIDRLDNISFKNWAGGVRDITLSNGNGAVDNAKLKLAADGSYILDAKFADSLSEGETLTHDETYTIQDNRSATASAVLRVTVTGKNDAPDAVNDSAAILENQTPTVTGNVMTNDTDIDRLDTKSFVSWADGTGTKTLTDADGATLKLNDDGSYELDARTADRLSAGEELTQSFSYTMKDNNNATDTATLTVKVTGVNDGPDANDDGVVVDANGDAVLVGNADPLLDDVLYSTLESAPYQGSDVKAGTAEDTDIDRNDVIRVTRVEGVADGAAGDLDLEANGVIEVALGSGALVRMYLDVDFASNGDFDYDPNGAFDFLAEGQSEVDSFSYTIEDFDVTTGVARGGSDTAKVYIRVDGADGDGGTDGDGGGGGGGGGGDPKENTPIDFPTMKNAISNVVLYLDDGDINTPVMKVKISPSAQLYDVDDLKIGDFIAAKDGAGVLGSNTTLAAISIHAGQEYPEKEPEDGTKNGEGVFYFLLDDDATQIVPVGYQINGKGPWQTDWTRDDNPLAPSVANDDIVQPGEVGITADLLMDKTSHDFTFDGTWA